MPGLVISSSNQTDLKLFMDLAQRIGVTIKSLSSDEMKNFGLSNLFSENEEQISKEELLNDIRESLSEVKEIKEGKLKKRTLKDSLNVK